MGDPTCCWQDDAEDDVAESGGDFLSLDFHIINMDDDSFIPSFFVVVQEEARSPMLLALDVLTVAEELLVSVACIVTMY